MIIAERFALTPFEKGHAAKDAETWSAAHLEVGQESLWSGIPLVGSFDKFAEDPSDADAYAAVKADMESMLRLLGGRPRLGGRRRRSRIWTRKGRPN